MKKILYIIVGILGYFNVSAFETENEFYETYHNEIILPQLEVWQRYANTVLPENKNNILCTWANKVLSDISEDIIDNPSSSIYEQRTKLSKYQSTICCALSYPAAWMDKKEAPKPAMIGIDMLKNNNLYVDSLKRADYKNGQLTLIYENYVFSDYISFLMLSAISQDKDPMIFEQTLRHNVDISNFIKMLYESNEDPEQLFYYASILTNISFYSAFEKMVQYMCGMKYYDGIKELLKDSGELFTAQLNYMVQAATNKQMGIPVMSQEDYIKYQKEAADHKIKLMEFLIAGAQPQEDKSSNTE